MIMFFIDLLSQASHINRANPERLREIFKKYATIEKDGEHFMTADNFIRSYLGLYTEPEYNEKTVKLLANIVDTSKDGYDF